MIDTPVPPLKCALVSEALGPVYEITPDELLYDIDPSPLLLYIDIADLTLESV